VEILLGELLMPWGWLRLVVLVASVYALVWVFGFYGSMVVLPHRLEAHGLRARCGALAERAGFPMKRSLPSSGPAARRRRSATD
jgi:hypothetical protein